MSASPFEQVAAAQPKRSENERAQKERLVFGASPERSDSGDREDDRNPADIVDMPGGKASFFEHRRRKIVEPIDDEIERNVAKWLGSGKVGIEVLIDDCMEVQHGK